MIFLFIILNIIGITLNQNIYPKTILKIVKKLLDIGIEGISFTKSAIINKNNGLSSQPKYVEITYISPPRNET